MNYCLSKTKRVLRPVVERKPLQFHFSQHILNERLLTCCSCMTSPRMVLFEPVEPLWDSAGVSRERMTVMQLSLIHI